MGSPSSQTRRRMNRREFLGKEFIILSSHAFATILGLFLSLNFASVFLPCLSRGCWVYIKNICEPLGKNGCWNLTELARRSNRQYSRLLCVPLSWFVRFASCVVTFWVMLRWSLLALASRLPSYSFDKFYQVGGYNFFPPFSWSSQLGKQLQNEI